jgi:SAM-dependent methyltransferase
MGSVNGYDIRACTACGTCFTAQLPAADEAKDYEDFYSQARDVPVPEFVLGRLEEIAAGFARYRQANRWLDIGCGAGTLLRAAANCCWDVTGTEVAEAAVERLRSEGFNVLVGETHELDLPPAHFDVVSLIEVVEHVHDPESLLADAARFVRPGGALYLTTPHGRGVSARLLRMGWGAIAPPEHLQLFSIGGMQSMLSRVGLQPHSIRTTAVNPYEIAAALRSRGRRSIGASGTDASYQLNESLSTRRSGTVIKRVVNSALTATRLGDTLKVIAERPGVCT